MTTPWCPEQQEVRGDAVSEGRFATYAHACRHDEAPDTRVISRLDHSASGRSRLGPELNSDLRQHTST
jgi:hypothetical protein